MYLEVESSCALYNIFDIISCRLRKASYPINYVSTCLTSYRINNTETYQGNVYNPSTKILILPRAKRPSLTIYNNIARVLRNS